MSMHKINLAYYFHWRHRRSVAVICARRAVVPLLVFVMMSCDDTSTKSRDTNGTIAVAKNDQETTDGDKQPPNRTILTWPDYDDALGWSKDGDLELILFRWELAISSNIWDSEAESKVRELVFSNLGHSNTSIKAMAFIDLNTVMLEASHFDAYLSAGSFMFVLSNRDGEWKILRRYILLVS